MSTIRSNIRITHQESGIAFAINSSRTSTDPGIALENITVGTSDEVVDVSEYGAPRNILLRLMSGDDLRVGLGGATYPFRLSGAGDFMVLRLDVEGIREISTITAGADVAGSLDGDYLDLTDRNGTVRVWFDVDNGSTPPSTPGSGRLLEVNIATGDSAETVATALQAAVDADAEFTATRSGAVVTVTDAYTGTRSDVSAGTTGWTVAKTQDGAASQAIHMKSVGSSQVVAGVIPD